MELVPRSAGTDVPAAAVVSLQVASIGEPRESKQRNIKALTPGGGGGRLILNFLSFATVKTDIARMSSTDPVMHRHYSHRGHRIGLPARPPD